MLKNMNLKTRKEVIDTKITSLALYGAELYTDQTEWTKNRFTAIMMRCNRDIYRKDWYMVSNRRICDEILVDHPLQICRKSTLKLFHKVVWNHKRPQLYEKLKFNSRHRECSKLCFKHPLRKK